MSAEPLTEEDERDRRTAKLRDVLYSGEPKAHPSENEWLELVRAIADRDQRALRSLYERSYRIVFTLIMRIVQDRQTAEELTLDVFHDVWRRAPQYQTTGSVLGWILNQARSRAIDRLRFDQRQKRIRPSGQDPLLEGGTTVGTDEALALTEDARLLKEGLAVLTARERDAIEITYFSELTYTQAAAQLNQPLGTLKTRIRSGLEKLRQALAGQ